MAESMHWFRWHHGSVTDPKFGLVAKRSGATLPEVLAVWAALLEAASASDDRGHPGAIDFEALDFALGMPDGRAEAIYAAMVDRGLIDPDGGRIAAWGRRQPRREDATAAERQRRSRDKRATEARHAPSRTVTPESEPSRTVTRGHDRGEENRREESIYTPPTPPSGGGDLSSAPLSANPGSSSTPALRPIVYHRGQERPASDDAWADRLETVWRKAKGGRLRRSDVIGMLCEHVDELGAEEVADRLRRYCGEVEGNFATLKRFAETIGDWSARRPPPRHASSSSVENMRRVMDELQEREGATKAAAGGGS